jgi:hypothetical protein
MTAPLVGITEIEKFPDPFAPVHRALRDVMTSDPPLTLEQVVNGAISVVLTFAVNIHISLFEAAKKKGTDPAEVPSVESIAATISFHAVHAAREAADEAREQFGFGATKQ